MGRQCECHVKRQLNFQSKCQIVHQSMCPRRCQIEWPKVKGQSPQAKNGSRFGAQAGADPVQDSMMHDGNQRLQNDKK